MCFWPAVTKKDLELFEMQTCLWPGAQIWFRQKRRKLVTSSPSLDCIDGYKRFPYWNKVFYAAFHVLDWSFLVLHFDGNVCNWISKLIWPWMDWSGVFLRKRLLSLTSYPFGLKWARIAQLLFFLTTSNFKLRGFLVCSLKMLVLFSYSVLQYWLRSLRSAMQLDFFSFCVYQPIFPASGAKTHWLLPKNK